MCLHLCYAFTRSLRSCGDGRRRRAIGETDWYVSRKAPWVRTSFGLTMCILYTCRVDGGRPDKSRVVTAYAGRNQAREEGKRLSRMKAGNGVSSWIIARLHVLYYILPPSTVGIPASKKPMLHMHKKTYTQTNQTKPNATPPVFNPPSSSPQSPPPYSPTTPPHTAPQPHDPAPASTH